MISRHPLPENDEILFDKHISYTQAKVGPTQERNQRRETTSRFINKPQEWMANIDCI